MNKTAKTINHLFLLMMIVYLVLLLVISTIACGFAYRGRKENILGSFNLAMANIDHEYTNILENFWQIYMPIFD